MRIFGIEKNYTLLLLKSGKYTSLIGGLLLCAMVFARYLSNTDQGFNSPVHSAIMTEEINDDPEDQHFPNVILPHSAMASMYVLESR